MKLEEASDRLGIPLVRLKQLVSTRLVHMSQGLVSIDDILSAQDASTSVRDLSTLLVEHAALKAEVGRMKHLMHYIFRLAGLQQHMHEFTDAQLLGLLGLARRGAEAFKPLTNQNVDFKLRSIIGLMGCITDRELRRMENASGAPRCWSSLIRLLDDLDDLLKSRKDLLLREDIRQRRVELNLARLHLANQSKFLLALQDPHCDPRLLLQEICIKASKVGLLDAETAGFDPGAVLNGLEDELGSSMTAGAGPT